MRTPAALALSLLLHAFAVWLVLHHDRAVVAAAKPKAPAVRATRVSLFSRPLERPAAAVARIEAPTRHLRSRTAALVAAPVEPEGDVALAAPAAEAEAEAGPAAEPSSGPPGPVVDAPAQARPSFDAAALHARLADSAQRCYPAAARRFGLTGQATVDFCLDASGALTSTALSVSTGQALLDVAARECVVKGALPFPPEAASGCYSVPVRFSR